MNTKVEKMTLIQLHRNPLAGDAFVSVAGGLRFKSLASHDGHSVANGWPPLQHFFKGSCVEREFNNADTGPETHNTLLRNTANKIKDLS